MSRRRPLIVSLAAGAALSLSACGGKKAGEEDLTTSKAPDPAEGAAPAPAPEVELPPDPKPFIYTNPPAALPPPVPTTDREDTILESFLKPDRSLPAWDEVKSPHPEGATNPPSPVLIVSPTGRCFKKYEGGMVPSGGDRVEYIASHAGVTAIQCPAERARATYVKWLEDGRPDPSVPGFPPQTRTP